jgi:hypothetical protein
MSEDNKTKLRASINAVEAGYEFMLAYAAQGWDVEQTGGGGGPSIRGYLENMKTGLETLADDFEALISIAENADKKLFRTYNDVLRADAMKAHSAISLIISLPSIGSQMIDNLNASIHVRALLTDIFLLDEAIQSLSKKPR